MRRAALVVASVVAVAGLSMTVAMAPRSAPTPAPVAADAFTVDAVHSSVLFRIKHLNTSYFYGRFKDVTGSFVLDPAHPEAGSITATVTADSVDTNNAKRDSHVKSPDFLSAKEYPTLTFKSTAIKKTSEHTFDVTGDLTCRGVTKSITVPVELTGQGPGMGGSTIAGLETVFTINRSDYGVSFMPQGLGEEIRIIVALEGAHK